MHKTIKNLYMVFAVVLLVSLFNFNGVKNVHADELGFSVDPAEDPHYSNGYFKLDVEPNQTVEVPIRIKNTSDSDMDFEINKLNALTSGYGNINYTDEIKTEHGNFVNPDMAMSQYLKGDGVVSLKSGEEKIMKFLLKTPENVNEGTMLGGLSFKKKIVNDDSKKSLINSEFKRVIAIQANYNKGVESPIKLSNSNVEITKESPNVLLGIKNESNSIKEGIYFDYKIMQGDKELFNGKSNKFKMAPSTEINYPIAWQDEKFSSGDYKLNVSYYEGEKKIDKVFDLKIPKEDVKKYKEESSSKPVADYDDLPKWAYIVIVLVTLNLFLLLFLLFKRKKEKKEEKEENDMDQQK